MKNVSLSTRLFLSCFLVSALLFCGIYFYVKGFNETRDFQLAQQNFDQAEVRLELMLRARHITVDQLAGDLVAHQAPSLARAEFKATGMTFAVVENGTVTASGVTIEGEDAQQLKHPQYVNLAAGHYLSRVRELGNARQLVLLYPLDELERASRELLEAFLVAGLILLLLSAVLAHILANEISRPLIALRDRMRAAAESIGFDPPEPRGDEIRDIAASYNEFAHHVQTAFDHKQLALDELEAYKAELLRVNSSLHRRLFQVKVLLSLWSERDKAMDVKDFLSRFLEALMPGLPFEYGCVIIRPMADLGSETIFAKKVAAPAANQHEEAGASTLWTDILDPTVKEFLMKESAGCMQTHAVRMSTVLGCVRPGTPPLPITVLSFRLHQGDEPLGSVHFLTEHSSPPIASGLNEFLLSLSAQVSAQLQIQALSFSTRLDPITRLYNRGYLNDRLREELVRTARKKEAFSLAYIEVEGFDTIAASHGQAAADDTLRNAASLLKATCRGSDAVCRVGGSVFAIVLADTPLGGARIFAENVRKAFELYPFPVLGGTLKLGVRIGLSEFPSSGVGVEALIAQAEHALHADKERAA